MSSHQLPTHTPTVLHVLPHLGGGGERVLGVLERIESYRHARAELSPARSPARALPTLALRRRRLQRMAEASDVVHVIGDTGALLTTDLLARGPSVFGTHGLNMLRRSTGARLGLVRAGLRRVLANATRTVCTSQAEREELLEVAPAAADRLVVVPNGIDLPTLPSDEERARARAKLGVDPGQLALLHLGRLDEFKDPLTAVRAAEQVRELGIDAVLLVAGDGPLAPDVERTRGPAVRPLGFCQEPSRLLAAADVFVLPSLREGLSFALLDAMGYGLACVVADGLGNAEAVAEAGLVVPPLAPAAMADALVKLSSEPTLRVRLSAAARERVRERFTADRQVGAMEAVFDAVRREGPIGGGRGASPAAA